MQSSFPKACYPSVRWHLVLTSQSLPHKGARLLGRSVILYPNVVSPSLIPQYMCQRRLCSATSTSAGLAS
jgi:hypothetical protein